MHGFGIVHSNINPENIVVSLEERDFPELWDLADLVDRQGELVLFVLEVAMLTFLYYKVVRKNAIFKIFFKSRDKVGELQSYLDFCVRNQCLVDFLCPPFRSKVFDMCRCFFYKAFCFLCKIIEVF